MAEEANQSEETVLEAIAGDYWQGSIFSKQIRGVYTFTSRKIRFDGYLGTTTFELPYADIAAAAPCNVGGFFKFLPTGILITTTEGKMYRFSIMKRKKFLEFIQSKL